VLLVPVVYDNRVGTGRILFLIFEILFHDISRAILHNNVNMKKTKLHAEYGTR